MKKLTIIAALTFGSICSFAQGSITCGDATFEFGVLTAVDKIPGGENEFINTHTYFEKTDSYFTFYEFSIDKNTTDTVYAYSYKVNLLSLEKVRSQMETKDVGSNAKKPFTLDLTDLTFSKKHIESNSFQCTVSTKENIAKGESMISWEFSTAAKRDEVMQLLKPYVNSEYR